MALLRELLKKMAVAPEPDTWNPTQIMGAPEGITTMSARKWATTRGYGGEGWSPGESFAETEYTGSPTFQEMMGRISPMPDALESFGESMTAGGTPLSIMNPEPELDTWADGTPKLGAPEGVTRMPSRKWAATRKPSRKWAVTRGYNE